MIITYRAFAVIHPDKSVDIEKEDSIRFWSFEQTDVEFMDFARKHPKRFIPVQVLWNTETNKEAE